MPKPSFFAYLRHREIDFVPTGRLRWWLLGLIVLGWAVEQYEALKNGPVLVYILADFDKSLVEWGQVAAVAGLVYSAGAIILSRVADRFGRRPLMIWPVFGYAVISVLGALSPNFWTLAFLFTAGSFLMAGMNPAVHAASRDLTPRMGRAMVYAWVSLAFTIGALMSTAVAAQTLPIWPGWRSQYWIAAALAGVTALLIYIFYRDLSLRVRGQILQSQLETPESEQMGPTPEAGNAYDDGRLVYRSVRLWLLSLVIVFWALTYVTVSGYVPTYLVQHHRLDPAHAAAVTSYFWIVFTISVFISRVVVRQVSGAQARDCLWWRHNGSVFLCGCQPGRRCLRRHLDSGLVHDWIFCRLHLSVMVRDLFRNGGEHQSSWRWSSLWDYRNPVTHCRFVFESGLTTGGESLGLVNLDDDCGRLLFLRGGLSRSR